MRGDKKNEKSHKAKTDETKSVTEEDPLGGSRRYLEGPLEGADGQQRQVLLLLCVPHQVHVHQLLQLKKIYSIITGQKNIYIKLNNKYRY